MVANAQRLLLEMPEHACCLVGKIMRAYVQWGRDEVWLLGHRRFYHRRILDE
jgi:hypothetical protein